MTDDVANVDLLARRRIERGLVYRTGRATYDFALPLFRSFIRRRRKPTEPSRICKKRADGWRREVTPEQRALRGRLGAAVLHSRYDSTGLTPAARHRFMERFVNEVDPHRRHPEAERLRRAEQARHAHFMRLALASAEARARRARSGRSKIEAAAI